VNKPTLPFYNLELSSEPDFWKQGDASTRHIFLMPVSTPSDFLSFGVSGSPEQVLFAARGTVRDHLGPFVARMVQDKSSVGLYARPPLPAWVLREYASAPPFEGQEYEEPTEQPIQGLLPGAPKDYEQTRNTPLWTQGDSFTRRTLLLPVKDPAEFQAIGMLRSSDDVLFHVRGLVQEHLGEFIARMREEASMEFHAQPPRKGHGEKQHR
jgi:hypothetical protein